VSAAGARKIGSAVGFPEVPSGNGDFETRPWRLKASLKTVPQASDVLPTAFQIKMIPGKKPKPENDQKQIATTV